MGATAQNRARAPRVAATGTVVDMAPPAAPALPDGVRIAGAMLAVQAAAPKLARDANGQVGSHTYRYVTLDGLLDAVMPLLVEHELMWSTMPCRDQVGEPALRYRMVHIPSGEVIEDEMPLLLAKADPQGQGSAITYARRYALLAVLNLAPGEDDDGAAATGGPVRTINSQAQPQATVPAPDGPRRGDGTRPASAKQKTLIKGRARAGKLGTVDLVEIMLGATGRDPLRYAPEVAQQKLGLELDRLPASAVDEVLAGIAARAAEIEHEGATS